MEKYEQYKEYCISKGISALQNVVQNILQMICLSAILFFV